MGRRFDFFSDGENPPSCDFMTFVMVFFCESGAYGLFKVA